MKKLQVKYSENIMVAGTGPGGGETSEENQRKKWET